ncbi:hypothetical protein ALC57_06174 [Trachymyrmex cornetzi]|uniref:Uncharacterized protein n=1 Tax=Trachymyrmex cornetzi TaxID=471704 RepID=A0A151J8Y2_9HYME|nr:hypothetical protein ALC57_06174 [Trachymyrmex cornetzi]
MKLEKKYGDRIIIERKNYCTTYILFRESLYNVLNVNFENKNQDAAMKAKKILEEAAKILKRDVKNIVYDSEYYPPTDKFLNNADNTNETIPHNLKYFLTVLIKDDHVKEQTTNRNRHVISIAHSIISAVRPRSFISTILLGLSVTLHRKFGKRNIIDIFNSHGFCASYHETLLFEASVAKFDDLRLKNGAFVQYVNDNADFDTNTIDGKNTFHNLGRIEIITPASSIEEKRPVPRLHYLPPANSFVDDGTIPVLPYPHAKKSGLQKVIVKIIDRNLSLASSNFSRLTLFWMFLQYRNSNLAIGWNGFFEHLTKSKKNYDVSAINFVDFVYNPPSDLDTLFTAAMKSVSTAKQYNMKTCFITYDQPLYHKTRDIVGASDFEGMNVIVRLGGFHMLMSFLGCIGKIMAGSGLKELLCEVYAEGTVKHILTGHAYARAVRAHTLIQLALAQFVFDEIKSKNSKFLEIFELDEISDMFFNSTEPESSNILNSEVLNDIDYLFEEQMQKIQRRSKTAELWVLYFRMVSILKDFIAAEKSGDWMSHLRNVELMIPFFHSAGHMSYAKSAQLYLQDMHELERHMDSLEYKTFTEGGYWTGRIHFGAEFLQIKPSNKR